MDVGSKNRVDEQIRTGEGMSGGRALIKDR